MTATRRTGHVEHRAAPVEAVGERSGEEHEDEPGQPADEDDASHECGRVGDARREDRQHDHEDAVREVAEPRGTPEATVVRAERGRGCRRRRSGGRRRRSGRRLRRHDLAGREPLPPAADVMARTTREDNPSRDRGLAPGSRGRYARASRGRPAGSRPGRRVARRCACASGLCWRSPSCVGMLAAGTAAFSALDAVDDHPGQFQSLAAAGSDVVCGIRTDETLDCWGRTAVAVSDPPPGCSQRSRPPAASPAACVATRRWRAGADGGPRSVPTRPARARRFVPRRRPGRGPGLRDPDRRRPRVFRGPRPPAPVATSRRSREGMAGPRGRRSTRIGRHRTRDLPAGTFVDVAAVHDVFGGCAIRAGGAIACWGDDSFGQASPPRARSSTSRPDAGPTAPSARAASSPAGASACTARPSHQPVASRRWRSAATPAAPSARPTAPSRAGVPTSAQPTTRPVAAVADRRHDRGGDPRGRDGGARGARRGTGRCGAMASRPPHPPSASSGSSPGRPSSCPSACLSSLASGPPRSTRHPASGSPRDSSHRGWS